MTPQTRIFRAEDAKQLLENKMFKDAFAAVDTYLNEAALSCSPDDATKAQRIVVSKQLLAAIQREIVRQVEDGDLARVQMKELETKRGLVRQFIR